MDSRGMPTAMARKASQRLKPKRRIGRRQASVQTQMRKTQSEMRKPVATTRDLKNGEKVRNIFTTTYATKPINQNKPARRRPDKYCPEPGRTADGMILTQRR